MSASVRTKHAFATGLAVVLTGGGLAAVAAPANAATGPQPYSCSYDGQSYSVGVDTDSNAPAKLAVGDSADVVVNSRVTFPSALVEALYADGARSFAGTIAASGTVNQAPLTINEAIPSTPLGNQMPPVAVEFVATSGALPFKGSVPGDVVLGAGDLNANLALTNADGSETTATVACKAPPGKALVVDTIVVVSKSSTTLTLSRTTAGYGAPVTATAKVATPGGTPAGDVAFVVGGVSTKVPVKDGFASLVIDQATVGTHAVSATFTPKDLVHYEGSSATPVNLKVSKAATSTRVKIIGKRVRERTSATIKVVGINKTVPTGKVKLVLRKAGNRGFHKVRRGTLAKGSRGFNLGRLGKGRYKVVAKYTGDGNHLRSKTVKRFRVRR